MSDKIFFGISFGFIFGILLQSFIEPNLYFAILGLGLFSILSIVYRFIIRDDMLLYFLIFLLAFSLGMLRFDLSALNTHYMYPGAEEVLATGVVVDEPDVRVNDEKLVVEISDTNHTKVLITTNLGEEYKYGDEVNFSGKMMRPENFMTDQGKEFDYVNYLKKDGVLYVMSYPKVEIISHDNGWWLKAKLFAIKENFIDKINQSIPEPENLFMGGLILGEKAQFSNDMRQEFVDTGTIHVVALSGYNVTIVAEWFMQIFKFLSQVAGISAGIVLIWLFVLMTGMSSTAVRAGIMATLALVARATGRSYDVARALVLAGVLMIIINPYVLVYDVSFQLSFIATVAVIFVAPRIEKYFMWVTKKFELRDVVTVTAAAYIFVLPFILYKMGNLSLVALPTNSLILPFIPFTMMLGFITGFVGLASSILAVPVGYIAYLFLHYELWVISTFAGLPFASMVIPDFPLVLTLLIYAAFIYWLFGKNIYKFFTEPQ